MTEEEGEKMEIEDALDVIRQEIQEKNLVEDFNEHAKDCDAISAVDKNDSWMTPWSGVIECCDIDCGGRIVLSQGAVIFLVEKILEDEIDEKVMEAMK